MNGTKHLESVLFDGAREIADPFERQAFLEQACLGNSELRRRLERLLAVDASAKTFFTLPPPSTRSDEAAAVNGDPTATAISGTNIGRYRLIERMGEGGCGVVYLAEQQHPVRRKVALKIVRLGMDTENVIARFEMERQSLALMDHPNIARVLDAGATATGRPYFVMELVDGEQVTDFCDKQQLGIRERLELFIQISLAIQHAHQKGVIHRDIKPSNILVRVHDGVAVPKVIDFGIAKATAGRLEGDTAFTAFDQFIGTPAYMSPEQAAGGEMDVDTRSDIYSLGVLLYELLTSRSPFDPKRFKESGIEEIRRILREEDPPSPSTVVATLTHQELTALSADHGGGSEVHKLAQNLKGDLDWIVMKAMEKDRQRRYETANGLAMDVRRHLHNEAVTAGPPGRRYRLRKLVRRNKVTFVAATLVLIALIIGLGTSSWLFFREKDARREAEVARANESMQRVRAELRETIAQAAVKIHHGDLLAADALLATVPVNGTPSSLEAANSYRAVGEMHVLEGRWDQAADRFASLARAMTRVDPSDSDNVSRNLLPAAAAICYSRDSARYEVIRSMAIERFAGTARPVVAEQVIKASLLMPADPETLLALEPFAEIIEQAIQSGRGAYGNDRHLIAWSSFSLALFNYRKGDDKHASEWANLCLASGHPDASRSASARILLALIEHQAGRPSNARAFLALAGPPIREKFTENLKLSETDQGFWFDWVNALILLREAEALIGE
ncbi:MAG: serine/threonine-protein kinase [Verrucomicrobiota bacterium]